jgi:peptidoglycan hydrolase CwlO-like protein
MLHITLINVLILFFILLIVSQIFLAIFNNTILEGLTSVVEQPPAISQPQPCINNPNTPATLTQQQLNSLMELNSEVQDISGNVAALQTQVNGMIGAQQQYAQNMTPNSPPNISGAVNSSS